ncbi:MAG: hypothetical protein RIN56_01630 [Sporomusaceae bacterium]|nr:hypothetical protein [Sporomusaceae bacterium]
MVKLRIALGLALIVAALTAAVGLVHGLRTPTVFYRAAISLTGAALAAYLAANLAEAYIRRRFAGVKPGRNKVDIISKDGIIENDELLNPSHVTPPFSPFVPENFEQISVK